MHGYSAEQIVGWVKSNIKVDNDWNPQRLCQSPESVWKYRRADAHSRDIFFVALMRSLGNGARIDEVTGKVQWLDTEDSSRWHDVAWSENLTTAVNPQGGLTATYSAAGRPDNPKYYSHFTLSKIVDAKAQLLNYPEEGVSWESLLAKPTVIDEGSYLLTTGTRMADGSVLAHLEFFPVFNGGVTEVAMQMRHDDAGIEVIGNFNSEDIYTDQKHGAKSLLSTTGRGYYVLGLIAPNEEPTNHALRDIAALKTEFEEWGRSIVLLAENEASLATIQANSDFSELPSTVVWGTDAQGLLMQEICDNMRLASKQRPVFVIADTFNRVVFVSQGYTIGLGEQMMRVIDKLSSKAK